MIDITEANKVLLASGQEFIVDVALYTPQGKLTMILRDDEYGRTSYSVTVLDGEWIEVLNRSTGYQWVDQVAALELVGGRIIKSVKFDAHYLKLRASKNIAVMWAITMWFVTIMIAIWFVSVAIVMTMVSVFWTTVLFMRWTYYKTFIEWQNEASESFNIWQA